MPANNYATFQEFDTIEEANKTGDILKQNSIPVHIEKTPDLLDDVIIGRQYNNYVQLRIPPEYFAQAQKILIDNTIVDLDKVDRNYMLFSLSNDELLEVVAKPDQWGAYNYNLAKLILQEKNIHINTHQLEDLHTDYYNELAAKRSIDGTWLFFGYGFSVIGIVAIFTNNIRALWLVYQFHLLPGILGLILGLIILTTKKTLPDGTQMVSYNNNARMHGRLMIALAIISVSLVLARSFLRQYLAI